MFFLGRGGRGRGGRGSGLPALWDWGSLLMVWRDEVVIMSYEKGADAGDGNREKG